MSLIPYAGKSTETRWSNKPARALEMFDSGKDTLYIARHFGISEATALRWINAERSVLLNLPNPYL